MRIRRVVQLTEEPTGLIACEAAGTGKSSLTEAVVRQLLARGRDVSVNVNEVPVRATSEAHRCADYADYIGGGWYSYECVVCGNRLCADDLGDEGGEQ